MSLLVTALAPLLLPVDIHSHQQHNERHSTFRWCRYTRTSLEHSKFFLTSRHHGSIRLRFSSDHRSFHICGRHGKGIKIDGLPCPFRDMIFCNVVSLVEFVNSKELSG